MLRIRIALSLSEESLLISRKCSFASSNPSAGKYVAYCSSPRDGTDYSASFRKVAFVMIGRAHKPMLPTHPKVT